MLLETKVLVLGVFIATGMLLPLALLANKAREYMCT